MDYSDNIERFLGYPVNSAYDYSPVFDSFKFRLNNIGDPYSPSSYKLNTKGKEREVMEFFQELWGFDKDNVWSYITASGTIGNLQGLFIGREAFPTAKFYTSADSHYSIFKCARILGLELIVVESQDNGEIDYKDFETKLKANLQYPAIINVNLGSTMKGAVDNSREIYRILSKYNKQTEYYMHGDGALMGFVLPFLEKDIFFKKCLHSISISGHKFLGIPFCCGVFMMERKFLSYVNNNIEYIGSNDATLMGSRSGQAPLFFEHIINQKGMKGFEEDVMKCIGNAEYMTQVLNEETNGNAQAWRNQNSITVVFNKPDKELAELWQLANEKDISHAIVMPHVTKHRINKFVKEYGGMISRGNSVKGITKKI
jgi:histidine decarboxylase